MILIDGDTYYTPEFPRGDPAAPFAFKVLRRGSARVTIAPQHRHTENDCFLDASHSYTRGGGQLFVDVSNLRERVRFRIALSGALPGDAAKVAYRRLSRKGS